MPDLQELQVASWPVLSTSCDIKNATIRLNHDVLNTDMDGMVGYISSSILEVRGYSLSFHEVRGCEGDW